MTVPGMLPIPLADVGQTFLPYATTDATWPYWGPDGANVMEQDNGPYKIATRSSRIPAQNVWVITVSAIPTDVGTATHYFGVGLTGGGKRVDYVAQFQ